MNWFWWILIILAVVIVLPFAVYFVNSLAAQAWYDTFIRNIKKHKNEKTQV